MTIAYGSGRWAVGLTLGIVTVGALAALDGGVALALALGGLLGALLHRPRGAPALDTGRHADLLRPAQVELARARRHDVGAKVLFAIFDSATPSAAEVVGALRITDGVGVLRDGRSLEACAVIPGDDAAAERAIEQRLSELAQTPPRLAWACFPSEGVTLDALISCARARLAEPVSPKSAGEHDRGARVNGSASEVALTPSTVPIGTSQDSVRQLSR